MGTWQYIAITVEAIDDGPTCRAVVQTAWTTVHEVHVCGELGPVGSTRTIRTDVRVIAATNRDLEEAVGRREFREDLYHRLSDVVLEVPPLRARQDDVPLLIEHFLGLFNRKYDLAVTGVAAQAMAAMTGYGWAGNVRALAKVLREAMLLREEGWVELDDLRIAASAGRGPFAKAGEY